jgi:transcriptional regulator with XRE-family HTH domain
MMDSAKALKLTMDEFGITGSQLSKISGVSQTQISEFLNGYRTVTSKNLEKIMQSLPMVARYYFLDLAYEAESSREAMKIHEPKTQPTFYSNLRLASQKGEYSV